jgi:hypothetical protein
VRHEDVPGRHRSALTAPPGAADLQISFDPALAFEWDRAHYDQLLREAVARAEREVTAWLGIERRRPLRVEVITKERYERALAAEQRWTVREVEEGFRYWVDHLQ